MMKTLILTNGEYGDYSFCETLSVYDYIICADNGMKHARYLGIEPDYIVGDFDSTDPKDLAYFKMKNVPVHTLPAMKDETDTEIALDKAIEAGADVIDIYGGVGSRLDHTLANVHLLYKALKQGVRVRLLNACNTVWLVDKWTEITGQAGDIVSLLPFSELVTGISTTDLGYPLKNASFTAGKPYGVSNYMVADKASISVESGVLVVIKAKD
ncbi:MAG: thiamine pyrophosphokinae [Clostridia bacterium]|jgi:thiamine pyrophosphokinase|nr:thiamine pyrophosphokinae [Clostridia bacterium]